VYSAAADLSPLFVFEPGVWRSLLAELRRRSDGRRESGAFLLAARHVDRVKITQVAYYDDLDATALRGGLRLGAAAFVRLWDLCDREGMHVAGDIHTHPWAIVSQSGIDRANPMVARVGHVALILPNYAKELVGAASIGVHLYGGATGWQSWFGADSARLVETGNVR